MSTKNRFTALWSIRGQRAINHTRKMTNQKLIEKSRQTMEDLESQDMMTETEQKAYNCLRRLTARLNTSETVISTIAKMEGAYSKDDLTFTHNVILRNQKIAEEYLKEYTQ